MGFYKEDYSGAPCTTDKRIDLQGKQYCIEGWLPESKCAEIIKNIMIFANGYRFYGKGAGGILLNSPKEYKEANNLITSEPINGYWSKESITEVNQTDMDLEFVARRKPDVVYYADGHHSITTSSQLADNMSDNCFAVLFRSLSSRINLSIRSALGISAINVWRGGWATFLNNS